MSSHHSSSFFSKSQPAVKDNPLSAAGRFGRLSMIGWQSFLNLSVFLAVIALSLFTGIFNLNAMAFSHNIIDILLSFTGFFYLVLVVSYLYFSLLIAVRRLHDLNKSGWLILLFFVPVIQFFFILYLLIAPGTRGNNSYGMPRTTALWEKILAWLVILLTVLSLFSIGSLVSYMMGAGELDTPAEVLQKGSEYF